MEDTLRDWADYCKQIEEGLNPCFNGRYSQRSVIIVNWSF